MVGEQLDVEDWVLFAAWNVDSHSSSVIEGLILVSGGSSVKFFPASFHIEKGLLEKELD